LSKDFPVSVLINKVFRVVKFSESDSFYAFTEKYSACSVVSIFPGSVRSQLR